MTATTRPRPIWEQIAERTKLAVGARGRVVLDDGRRLQFRVFPRRAWPGERHAVAVVLSDDDTYRVSYVQLGMCADVYPEGDAADVSADALGRTIERLVLGREAAP